MTDNISHLELVRRAQLGSQEDLSELAQVVQGRIFAYIYRFTLDYDLAQDLLQTTMLEMVKSLKTSEFEHANQFWAWLYRIAFCKFQTYLRNQRTKTIVQMSTIDSEYLIKHASTDYGDGVKNLMKKELSNAIFNAMAKLNFRQRNVLVLRCFEQMPYSQVAAVMDCSEMAAQVLFYRAKHSLKRHLSRRGFSKKYWLVALAAFAKATAPAEASSATVTVAAASAKVGLVATILGAAGTKLGTAVIATVTAATLATAAITTIDKNSNAFTNTGSPRTHKETVAYPALRNYRNFSREKEAFEHPSSILNAYDPDGQGWDGKDAKGKIINAPTPKRWFTDRPMESFSQITLPTEHWIELKFNSKIIDGPGNDILIAERGEHGEKARVFITNGAGQEYLLGTAATFTGRWPAGLRWMGFDIAGIDLPFEPCAVRILGMDKKGKHLPGFNLSRVHARTKTN